MNTFVQIPHSYEGLERLISRNNLAHVVIKSDPDITACLSAISEVKSSAQGKISFVFGTSGVGKSTIINSLQVFLPQVVNGVITPPLENEVPLKALPGWLSDNIQKKSQANRVLIVNLDGRESPKVTDPSSMDAFHELNGLLRRTPNVLVLWPVTRRNFAETAIEKFKEVGGQTALTSTAIINFLGLSKEKYIPALELILTVTGRKLEDAALTTMEVQNYVDESDNIGGFLLLVSRAITKSYDIGAMSQKLPKLIIAVCSSDDTVANSCRQLTRGRDFLVDPDRLLTFSRANVSDDWRNRGKKSPRAGLPFVSSLFEVKLVHLTASLVVNCATTYGEDRLVQIVKNHYPKAVSSNAKNLMSSSALLKAINNGEESVGGKTTQVSQQVSDAYDDLHAIAAGSDGHKMLNASLVEALKAVLGSEFSDRFFVEKLIVEDKGLKADVLMLNSDEQITIEFTYRNQGSSSAATISSYVLEKIQDYARDFNLI